MTPPDPPPAPLCGNCHGFGCPACAWEDDPTVVRLPLLPSPDELQKMQADRARIEGLLAEQAAGAVRSVADCARALKGAGEQLDRAVQVARAAGAGWTQIGRAVGISRQAAAERWGR